MDWQKENFKKQVKKFADGGEVQPDPLPPGVDANPRPTKVPRQGGLEAMSLPLPQYKDGGPVLETPNPAKKHKKLSANQKAQAKASAKKAGRPYPNLIDNMKVAKK